MYPQSWLKAFFLITSSFAYILQTRDIKTATLSASASAQEKIFEGTEKNLQALANISTVLQECINVTDFTMGYTWITANTDTQKTAGCSHTLLFFYQCKHFHNSMEVGTGQYYEKLTLKKLLYLNAKL